MLRASEKSLSLYEDFFRERQRWYAARGKRKKPPVDADVGVLEEISAESEPSLGDDVIDSKLD